MRRIFVQPVRNRFAAVAALLAVSACFAVPFAPRAHAANAAPIPGGRNVSAALLRSKIAYVFVIYQENRSFDSYFGTFPGAEGLYSHPGRREPGFEQPILDTDGTTTLIRPFRIGPAQYASDTDDVDHSHTGIVAKMDLIDGARAWIVSR